jgi:phosphatidylserine/phosphatidylglycerophosphate/cardiolipin synthase-like enzyme/uncharacterized membrane protein YdjX (TVP38/TMEM64 family)
MHPRIFVPERNVWRVAKAERAAVLIDGAAFFGVVRSAFLRAQRRIFIVGWDIDSRTQLVGSQKQPEDGFSPVFSEFLSELAASKSHLEIYLLLWDFSAVYAVEREAFPRLSLQWSTPPRVTLCMDGAVPFGSSQHQKLIVVDDALAFSGGLDLTIRRWDRSDHTPNNPERVDPSGPPYPPFHDVQMMVDGEAALALAQLVRRRWCHAHGTEPPVEPLGNPWPTCIQPHFENVAIGIARTQPEYGAQKSVQEVQNLYLDSIERAEKSIYIENQFLTSMPVAECLAKRLRARQELEVLMVAPRTYDSWIISKTLGCERAEFYRTVKAAGGDRVSLCYPRVEAGPDVANTMVHSKVMIVDDRFLRIGSANLNNRSMGADTECDLAIEASAATERKAITDVRNQLLADHCGVSEGKVAETLKIQGLITAANSLAGNGHRLCSLKEELASVESVPQVITEVVDPEKPLGTLYPWSKLKHFLARGPAVALGLLALVVIAITLLWSLTPISEFATHERVQSILAPLTESQWAALWVVTIYVAGGLVAFPILALILATAATFGPWLGFVYALLGVIASALVTFFVGAGLGRNAMQSLLGSRWDQVRKAVDRRGILALAAVRLVPVAPFTLVNLAAGACAISVFDYVAATLIGMLPGLVAISALGHRITALLTDLSIQNVGLVAICMAGWIGLALGAQILVRRLRAKS